MTNDNGNGSKKIHGNLVDDPVRAQQLVSRLRNACGEYPIPMAAWALQVLICELALLTQVHLRDLVANLRAVHASVRKEVEEKRKAQANLQ